MDKIEAVVIIQTTVRAFLVKLNVVHRPRSLYLSINETIMKELVNDKEIINKSVLPFFKNGRNLVKPTFHQFNVKPLLQEQDQDDMVQIDVRSTAELENELRIVREKLAKVKISSPSSPSSISQPESIIYDCFVTTNGEPLCLVPSEVVLSTDILIDLSSEKNNLVHPRNGMNIYFVTACNPRGFQCTIDENSRANSLLLKELQKINGSAGQPMFEIWQAFRVNIDKNWREDGYAVVIKNNNLGIENAIFEKDKYIDLELSILNIASSFGHNTIYSYSLYKNVENVINFQNNSTWIRELLKLNKSNNYGVTSSSVIKDYKIEMCTSPLPLQGNIFTPVSHSI